MLPVDPPSGTNLASVPRREGVSEEEHERVMQVVQERLRAWDRSRPNYARIPIPLPPQISASGQQPMHQRPPPNQQPAHQQSRPPFQRPPNQQPRPQRPSYQPLLPNQPRAPNQVRASSILHRIDVPIPQLQHNGRQPIYMSQQPPPNQQQLPPFQPQSNQNPYYPQPSYQQQPLPNQPPPYQPNQQYPPFQHQNQQRPRAPDMITLQFQPNSLNHIVYHSAAFDENSPRYAERTYNQLARALRGEARIGYFNGDHNSTYSKPIYDPNVSSTSNELPGDT